MLDYWASLAYTTKFSLIAWVSSMALTMCTLGMLGVFLYYPVSFLFSGYPTLNDWTGNWVWPAVIVVGLAWSFSFLIAGIVWHYAAHYLESIIALRFIYGLVLWLAAAVLYYIVIKRNLG